MSLNKNGYLFLTCILLLAIGVSVLSYSIAYSNAFELSVRLFALNGFLALSIATIMTSFLREIKQFFNKPFLNMHHSFAAIGLVLITLHPITVFGQILDPTIFLPNFSSFSLFWELAGRQALIIIYVALAAVLLRRKISNSGKYWRGIHGLMYLALLFGIVHANLIGTDFQNTPIIIIYNTLFVVVLSAFVMKRSQQYRIRNAHIRAQ
jgi:DMSO/TMAO reductase YedYZ heme-binding membrane subunit